MLLEYFILIFTKERRKEIEFISARPLSAVLVPEVFFINFHHRDLKKVSSKAL